MLLLRNLFATQLFELGHVRGVLGCGLDLPGQQLHSTTQIVEGLVKASIVETLQRLHRSPATDLDEVLSRRAAALWTNSPSDRLFST
jgi:hypothetical protein